MASTENSYSDPLNLKIFWERIPPEPPTRLVPSAVSIMPPCYKNLATALNLQQVFTKTRLEDVDLSKPQPCNYLVYVCTEEIQAKTEEWLLLTVFALLYFEFEGSFRIQVPGGLYLEGFFAL